VEAIPILSQNQIQGLSGIYSGRAARVEEGKIPAGESVEFQPRPFGADIQDTEEVVEESLSLENKELR
jgi:translation elongation factor EF-1alpha